MKMASSWFSLALSILLLNSITLCFCATILTSTTDKHALVSFKSSIISDPDAILSTNWSENTSVCNWIGVTCGLKHRRVTALNLSGFDLAGTLSPHLGNLTFLIYLDISSNYFKGSLPFELSNLRRLKVMNVGVNSFTGEIPTWLGGLPQLKQLYLYNNNFSGRVPPEIGNLSRLEILDIERASLTGNIPSSIFNISSLTTLSLFNNSLSGQIPPNIWKCRNLEILILSHNNFSGNIPREIGNMSMLGVLYLGYNNFTGELPQQIGTLPVLERLGVLSNSLYGSIPSSIFNISTLKILELSYNEFSGSLPSELGPSLFTLKALLLASNRLTGLIPTSIANASKLTFLDMADNSFSGFMPDFANLKLLQTLCLWENNLIGAESPTQELTFLSSLTNCTYLNHLAVSGNPLNGVLPASIGNFPTSLEYIEASYSNIMGVIPPEIGNLSSLLFLNLASNQLNGPIPPTIGKMKKLQRLHLYDNQLVKSIPNDLCGLNNLGELILDRNMLTGPIPECLGEVKSLRLISLDFNQLNSTIPPMFWTLTDLVHLSLSFNHFNGQLSSQLGNLMVISYLDLSSNQFSGDIPSLIDGCETLEFLNLSNNLFSGPIPQSLGQVKGLITLDLSYNNLSGLIPKSLEDLLFLYNFNVSNNKLEGKIPDGGHFGNYTAQSFSNNSALCGPITFQVPPCPKNHHIWFKKFMVPLVILGVIAVTVMLVLIIRTCKQKKIAVSTDISAPNTECRRISYMELQRGTSSFSEINLLGKGSFGSVFKATLSDGLKVAVKVFNLQLQGATRSFDVETTILSSIRHRNLVRVIGCCSNTDFKALILTYMPCGSLDKWLHSNMYHLDLIQRLKIAIDVATALEYLHHGYTFPVVHCDVKPNNVLLDQDMTAHLADFGISKLFDAGEAAIQTQTVATIGYAAPELGMEGKVSTNGDVYSFGIMLLEMFTGKKPTDDMFGEERSLKEWVSEALIKENAATEIVVPSLLSREDPNFSAKEQCMLSIFELSMKCLAVSADERINMIEAAATLRKIYPLYVFSVSIHNNGV